MEKEDYGINWLGLFIKVIIFVIVILFAIWLISKINLKNKTKTFEENNQLYQEAVVKYFSENLPTDENSKTITLKDLIKWDYLSELKIKNKICDSAKSTSTITLNEKYYSIKTELICGSQSQTSYIKLGNETCKECDKKIEGLIIDYEDNTEEKEEPETIEENKNVTENPSNTSQTSNTAKDDKTTNTTILYEYVKEVNEYSDWYKGKVTGENIENSKEKISYGKFCKDEEKTYYSSGYVTEPKNYTYQFELKNIEEASNFEIKASYLSTSTDYKNYIKQKIEKVEEEGLGKYEIDITNAKDFQNASLKNKNFTYEVSDVYEKDNKYYIEIKVNVKNLNNITPYKTSKGNKVYFVPIKITINYTDMSNCTTSTKEETKKGYTKVETFTEEIDIYRYKITTYEYKYSNLTSLEGYKKTGKTKQVTN